MDTKDYIFLGIGLACIVAVVVWCLWQRKNCWYTWKKCILSLGDCDWCREKLSNFRFELNRRNRAMEINAICDDIPNIHGIRYIPPPNYADVIYLPNYEEAMQVQFQ